MRQIFFFNFLCSFDFFFKKRENVIKLVGEGARLIRSVKLTPLMMMTSKKGQQDGRGGGWGGGNSRRGTAAAVETTTTTAQQEKNVIFNDKVPSY